MVRLVPRLRGRKPRGIAITPDRIIDIHELDIEGTVAWGEDGDERGRPCWIVPNDFRQTKNFPFILLSTNSVTPLTFPGETPVEKTMPKLSQAMGEQFAKQRSISESGNSMTGKIVILFALVITTLLFSAAVSAFIIPSLIKQYF